MHTLHPQYVIGGNGCRAYGAQIIFGIDPQPCRAGLKFSGRPSRALAMRGIPLCLLVSRRGP